MVFVGVDGGEGEEPLVKSLEVVPLDLYRMVKCWFYEVVDSFGDEAEVQSRRSLARGLLYDRDDRLGGQGRKGITVVGHWERFDNCCLLNTLQLAHSPYYRSQ